MRGLDLQIRTFGWNLTQVEDAAPWSYTIGLGQSYGHPELVITDINLPKQSMVIRTLVSFIERTGCIEPSELERRGVSLVPVHPVHLEGDLFGTWANYYERLPAPGSFLQVIPPSEWFCECHQHSMRRLDRADGLPMPPNRATRRAAQRNRHGGR